MVLVAALPPPEVSPDDARRAAEEILSRAEYREPQPSLVDRFLDAVGEFLADAIGALTGGGPGSLIGTAVLGALVAGAVWFIVRSLATDWAGVPAVAGPEIVQGASRLDDPDEWAREADRLEAAGDLRGALRCRYQSFVARVHVDRTVDARAGRTPAELAALLATRVPEAADDLARVTDAFEEAWYGGRDVEAVRLGELSATLRELPHRLRGSRASAEVGS